MKSILPFVAASAMFVATLASHNAQAHGDRRDFWLLNETGRTIREVHFAAHNSSESWGSDVLGIANLPDGIGTKVIFYSGSACAMDFHIVYADGSQEDYLEGRNLCAATAVSFVPGGLNYAYSVATGI